MTSNLLSMSSNLEPNNDQSKDDHQVAAETPTNNPTSSFLQRMDLNAARAVLAELVGTFMLLFCICGIIATTALGKGKDHLLEYAVTAGLTVVVVIFSIGPISGAHINPAVTLAFAIFGYFPWSKVPPYILAQTLGSVLGTYIGSCVYGVKSELFTTRSVHSSISAFWVELIATFIILFLITSFNHEARIVGHVSGFVIGISIGLGVLITGPVSGGSMNPARSLGPAILSWSFRDIWVYITAPFLGAFLGCLLSRFLRLRPHLSTSLVGSLVLNGS